MAISENNSGPNKYYKSCHRRRNCTIFPNGKGSSISTSKQCKEKGMMFCYFFDWLLNIQKSDKAQKEFMKMFLEAMTEQPEEKFDPLNTLKSMTSQIEQAQKTFADNIQGMQNNAMNNMFTFGNMFSNILSYSSFKTVIGSNGRISIPETEREALGLEEKDMVQVFVIPINKKQERKK